MELTSLELIVLSEIMTTPFLRENIHKVIQEGGSEVTTWLDTVIETVDSVDEQVLNGVFSSLTRKGIIDKCGVDDDVELIIYINRLPKEVR